MKAIRFNSIGSRVLTETMYGTWWKTNLYGIHASTHSNTLEISSLNCDRAVPLKLLQAHACKQAIKDSFTSTLCASTLDFGVGLQIRKLSITSSINHFTRSSPPFIPNPNFLFSYPTSMCNSWCTYLKPNSSSIILRIVKGMKGNIKWK